MRGDEVAHGPVVRAGAYGDGSGLFEAIVVDPIGSQEQLALPRQGRAAEGVSAGPHAQCLARASRAGDQCLDLRRGARACDRIVFAAVVELSVIVEAFGVAHLLLAWESRLTARSEEHTSEL